MKNVIQVKNLVKKFKEVTAVDGISFSVQKGEIFGFLGPNGAGKSTTIKMITTLLDKTSGSIMLDGKDPEKNQNEVRSVLGIVFQDPSLDDELTALENLKYHGMLYNMDKNLRESRITELLKLVELEDRKGDLVKTFSGGMKRRLEIARGLMHHPKVLFLDEPTLGLDPQTRNKMWDYVKDLNKKEGITVFFTTHYMEEAERAADRIAIIDHGKIIAEGTPDELKTKTKSKSLEGAFLKLTGSSIRHETASSTDSLKKFGRMFGGRK